MTHFRFFAPLSNYAQYAPLVAGTADGSRTLSSLRSPRPSGSPDADVGRALARQAQMYEQSRQFFERYDYFILPVTQVSRST